MKTLLATSLPLLIGGACLLAGPAATAQTTAPQAAPPPPTSVAGIPVNYDEALVGAYTLPELLRLANGKPVKTARDWQRKRRPELVRLFEENQFGRVPAAAAAAKPRFEVFDQGTPAFGGKATRKQVTVYFSPDDNGPKMDLLLYVPAGSPGPVPLLLNISFLANSSVVDDPGVRAGKVWNTKDKQLVAAPAYTERFRLPVEQLLAQGFGVATVYYGDIEPDFADGFRYGGVRSLYLQPGQTTFAPDAWGTIGAWAWGLSRALDYLETDPAVDARRVALQGISRLGKTVLWAGAHDPRFAMVIASCSGEGGAALSRRNYGETVAHITAPMRYHYQFAPRYQSYGPRLNELPVDAHLLVSLLAPRPLLLVTGNTDYWSDPKGEFLAAVAAGPAYRLLGRPDLGTTALPPAGQPILHSLGFYMHDGGHTILPSDYAVFIEFMRQYLKPDK